MRPCTGARQAPEQGEREVAEATAEVERATSECDDGITENLERPASRPRYMESGTDTAPLYVTSTTPAYVGALVPMGMYGPIATLWNGGTDQLKFPEDQFKLHGCVHFTKETCYCGF